MNTLLQYHVLAPLVLCLVYGGTIQYTCMSSDGLPMQAGQGYVPTRCKYCKCQNSGEVTCEMIECSSIPGCKNYELPPGGCCPMCVDDGPLIII
nr:putative collagen alpha-1(II) chain [Biomphalaria glabrata]